MRGEFTQRDTRKLEATDVSAFAAGGIATAAKTDGARIARKQGEANVVSGFLHFSANCGVFRHSFRFAFFAFEPAGFCHK